jgi:gas vesicle protein
MEKFIIGVAVGGVCGALLIANSYKMRALVKKGQDELQKKFDDMLDEKLKDMGQQIDETAKDVQALGKKAVKKVKEKAKKLTENA